MIIILARHAKLQVEDELFTRRRVLCNRFQQIFVARDAWPTSRVGSCTAQWFCSWHKKPGLNTQCANTAVLVHCIFKELSSVYFVVVADEFVAEISSFASLSTEIVIFCLIFRKQTAGTQTAPTGKSIWGQRTLFTMNVAVPAKASFSRQTPNKRIHMPAWSLFKSSSSSTSPASTILGRPPAIDSVEVTMSPDDGS